MDSPCRIEMLGGLKVIRPQQSGEEARVISRFATHKTAALLAYLAYHLKQPAQPRELLADMLWPDATVEAGRASLRAALASLRRQLEPPGVLPGSILIADRFAARLNSLTVTTDTAEFEAALRTLSRENRIAENKTFTANKLSAANNFTPNGRLERLTQATALYTGDLLPGFYETWTVGERERLQNHYLELLREISILVEHTGGTALAPEISPQIITANLDVKGQIPARSTLPSRLPLNLTRFFGRAAERARLQDLLYGGSLDERARLVTLTGQGGAGKTRLAVEVARSLAALPDLRLVFVSLAEVATPHLALSAIADALRPAGSSGAGASEAETWDQITAALTGWETAILVLDNYEQLTTPEGAQIVQALLSRLPNLSCLVTSRRPLLLEGEREFPLLPLPTPADLNTPNTPERLLDFASAQLFLDRAQAVRPDFQLTPGNAQNVALLCQKLEGIPLALELTATWVQTLSLAQMLKQLERPLDLLVSRHPTQIPRHQSLRAAFKGSYDLLTPQLQTFFAQLAVFRGGWTLAAAETVCPSPHALQALTRLRENSLIVVESNIAEEGEAGNDREANIETRFRMVEAAREYAWEQLNEQAQEDILRRHTEYFVALAEKLDPELRGPEQASGLARLNVEHDNIRAILTRWENFPEQAMRLAGSLGRFWLIRGHWREGRDWLHKLLSAGQNMPGPILARACASAAALAWALDSYEEATGLGEQSLRLCREHEDAWGAAYAQTLLGIVAVRQGNHPHATVLLQASLTAFRQLQDRWGMAYALDNLAYAAREAGEYERASGLHEESLSLRTAQGDRQGIAISLSNMGDIALLQEDWEEAAILHGDSLERFRALGDKVGTAYALGKLGVAGLEQKRLAHAHDLCRASLTLLWELRDKRRLAECLGDIARVCASSERHEKAARLFGAADTLRQAIGASASPRAVSDWERCIAATRTAMGIKAFTRARMQGQALTLEEAVTIALQTD